MPLPTFASLDEVPEQFRDEYELVDGKAVSKDFRELRSSIAKERAEREAAAKALKDAQARLDEMETTMKARKSGLSDEKLAELRADIAKQVEPVAQERDALRAQLRSLQLDGAVKSLMADSGVRAERIDTLWRLVSDRFDLTDGGKPVLKDDPASDVKKALGGLVKEYPEFFAAPAAAGGGATASAAQLTNRADMAALAVSNPMALLELANTQKAA